MILDLAEHESYKHIRYYFSVILLIHKGQLICLYDRIYDSHFNLLYEIVHKSVHYIEVSRTQTNKSAHT